jgi:hypothetical protein
VSARTTPRWGDRAVNTRTGEQGTVIDVHDKVTPANLGVLPDDGPKALVVWRGSEVEWTPATSRRDCPRCGDQHRVIDCPVWDVS